MAVDQKGKGGVNAPSSATLVPKKGTPKTESIIGQSVVSLEGALKNLENAQKAFAEMPKMLTEMSAQIADKEAKIAYLDVEFQEKKRASEVAFKLEISEDKDTVVRQILDSSERMSIKKSDYQEMVQKIAQLQSSCDKEVQAAVAAATAGVKARAESDMKIAEANWKASEAQNTAKIESLNNQLTTLGAELASWKKALDSERDASVLRAQAASIGSVNISGSGK